MAANQGNVDLTQAGLTEEQQRFLQAQMGTGNKKQASKFVLMQEGVTETFEKDSIDQNAIIFFKACKDCTYTVESRCTKIFIEDCHNMKFHFKAKIITAVVEVWKCTNVDLTIDTQVKTLQVDLNKVMNVTFASEMLFENVVWAGCEDMLLKFVKEGTQLKTGVAEMKKEFPDLLPDIDQFKISLLDGKIVSERIVRLKGGYPSTNREADAFDAQVAANDKKYMQYVREMVRDNPSLLNSVQKKGAQGAREIKAKVKPNAPCPCKSGKKYKKCCGDPKNENRKRDLVVHDLDSSDTTNDNDASSSTSSSVDATTPSPDATPATETPC